MKRNSKESLRSKCAAMLLSSNQYITSRKEFYGEQRVVKIDLGIPPSTFLQLDDVFSFIPTLQDLL